MKKEALEPDGCRGGFGLFEGGDDSEFVEGYFVPGCILLAGVEEDSRMEELSKIKLLFPYPAALSFYYPVLYQQHLPPEPPHPIRRLLALPPKLFPLLRHLSPHQLTHYLLYLPRHQPLPLQNVVQSIQLLVDSIC